MSARIRTHTHAYTPPHRHTPHIPSQPDTGRHIFSASCDNTVRRWAVDSPSSPTHSCSEIVAVHAKPVNALQVLTPSGSMGRVLVTGGWDGMVKVWDLRALGETRKPALEFAPSPDHDPVCALAAGNGASAHYLAVALTDGPRTYGVYDLRRYSPGFGEAASAVAHDTIYKGSTDPLHHQTRCVAAFSQADGDPGFCLGSVEGRVAVKYVHSSAKNFAYKCHRDLSGPTAKVFAVNDIAFHPKFKSFATCGADGKYNFWDKDTKRRIHEFPQGPRQVSSCSFNADGRLFAYASSYDWSLGDEGYDPAEPNEIRCISITESWVRTK